MVPLPSLVKSGRRFLEWKCGNTDTGTGVLPLSGVQRGNGESQLCYLCPGGLGSSKLGGRPRALASTAEALPKEDRPCEGSDSDVGVSALTGLAAVEKTRKVGALG